MTKIAKQLLCGLIISLVTITSVCCTSSNEKFLSKIENSKTLAIHWFRQNFRKKGLWHYIYKPVKDRYPNSNNALRQLMGSRLAAELGQEDLVFQDIHRRNLDFIMNNWYVEKDDIAYIYYSDKSKLGANAMLLRTFAFSPFYDSYKEQAAKVANGIISLMDEDGSFHPWVIEPKYNYNSDYLITFYSGEALLALLDYYEVSKDETILEAAKKSQDYYIEKYVINLADNYYPAYVPWHTQSLSKLYSITKDKKYADAIFVLNDKLLELQDSEEFIGRFYNKKTPEYGKPHSASDGVYVEGLAYAYEIATLVNDSERVVTYKKAIEIGMENLFSLQYCNGAPVKHYTEVQVCGAFKYRVNDDRIRIDTTQHTLDAIIQIEKVWH